MSGAFPDIMDAKAQARRAALAARDAADAATRARLAARLAVEGARIAATRPRGEVVALFYSMRTEPDLRPLADALRAAGRDLCLPVMQGRAAPLIFRRWTPGDALVAARFGVSEPGPDAPLVSPSILFTPLAGFDRAGYRIGYGGGFYDRTLAQSRAARDILAVGVAFSAQELPRVPREPTDARLDMILTETETLEMD